MISDDDKAQIKAFVDNAKMFDAVKRVLLPDLPDFSTLDRTKDDAEYGRKVKVAVESHETIKEHFSTLQRLASTNPQPATENPAR
jgi:hypothetical protein